MHPARGVDGFAGSLLVAPVTQHDAVAPGQDLAGLARRHDPAFFVDHLGLDMRLHPADGRDAARNRVVGGALEADRAGLGHAVGDRDLVHVHLVDDPLHHLDRAGRARHDAGAQVREIEAGEFGMVQLGDEHGRDPVQRRAALGLDRLQHFRRIEALSGEDHRGAVRQASEVAQHHAEAMIERHRDAEPVGLREVHRLADEVAVVQDVVVGQRRPLGEAGGAAGELYVDGVVEL